MAVLPSVVSRPLDLKKQNKTIPSEKSIGQPGGNIGSASSLPITETEEDLVGKWSRLLV